MNSSINKLKQVLFLSLLSTLVITSIPLSSNWAGAVTTANYVEDSLPQKTVRVGLTNYKTVLESVSVTVQDGFSLFHYGNQSHTELLTASSQNEITFSKGKIHIQVGEEGRNVFLTKEEASAVYAKWSAKYPSSFIGYDEGWKVYHGTYYDVSAAQNEMKRLMVENVNRTFEVDDTINQVVEISDQSGTYFLYNAKEGEFYIKSKSNTLKDSGLKFSNKAYRGGFGARLYSQTSGSTGLILVNYVGLEDYLKGVITREMGVGWPLEALKSQAVASRTYAVSSLRKHEKQGFDLCNTTDCQVYSGISAESIVSNQAIEETRGLIMTYANKPINAVFHANSGGQTESAQNIWGGKVPIPYLVGVKDPYSETMPYSKWEKSYTVSQLTQLLAKSNYDLGNVSGISITSKSENGRALSVNVIGSNGKTIEFKRESFRSLLGSTTFRSIWYDVAFEANGSNEIVSRSGDNSNVTLYTNDDKIIFRGRGYGHGVGMSQWGAKNMAEQKMGYQDILNHYYTQIKIEPYQ